MGTSVGRAEWLTASIVRRTTRTRSLTRASGRFARPSEDAFRPHPFRRGSARMRSRATQGRMSQDTLSDVLRSVRLRSAVFYFVSCEGEWVAVAPASREIADAVMPDAEHVIEYHVVTAGECWAAVAASRRCKLKRGDIVMLPQGDAHVVSSAPGMRADAGRRLVLRDAAQPPAVPRALLRAATCAARSIRSTACDERYDHARLRVHRLRRAAVQSAARDAAAAAASAGARRAASGASSSCSWPRAESRQQAARAARRCSSA